MRLLLCLCIAMPLATCAQSPELPPSSQAATFEAALPVALPYALLLPEGYEADEDTRWPLVLFLHGSGERGEDLSRVAIHGPLKEVREGRAFPFVLVAPQLPAARPRWEVRELGALLDHIEATHRIDPARVYVTGLSMGGYATWDLVMHFPDRFAAAAPVCGGGLPFRAPAFSGTPIWAFHGALDGIVPLERSAEMARAINASGGEVKLTVYPEAAHDAWTATYADPAFYAWLLNHTRD
ncbi:MAG: prolyl oligopeptidase family serine peptidase [Bacteroidota bacterium]